MEHRKTKWIVMLGAIAIVAAIIAAGSDKIGYTPHIDYSSTKEPSTTQPTTAAAENKTTQLEWNLLLVNYKHLLPEDFEVELAKIGDNHRVDARILEPLTKMLNDAESEGLQPYICSSYRENAVQVALYNRKVGQYLGKGYSDEEAENNASEWVARPLTSGHQTGLSVDIVPIYNQVLSDELADTAECKWLKENCAKYGFILRYPQGKEEITGINFEPWHFRYVGVEAAKEIMEKEITLEEYLDMT